VHSGPENTGEFTLRDWVLFVSIAGIWGSSFLLIAFALEGLEPSTITIGRVGLGALTLWGIRLLGSNRTRIDREDYPRLIALSLLWVAIPFSLFPLAQEHINSAVTGLLNGAMPIFAAVISIVLFRVAPRGAQLLGIIVGFSGIVLVSVGSAGDESSQLRGILMVLAATLCYGLAVNLAPPLQRKYGAMVLMSSVLGLATLAVIPLGFRDFGENSWELGPIASVIALGAIGTGAAYWIMSTLVGRVGAIRASFITYLIPVVSLVLGVVIRNDVVEPIALVGAILTIGGALLASRKQANG